MRAAPFPTPIELVAIDEVRNVRRQYRIEICQDLFGFTLVETRWGRIGSRGQLAVHAFEDENEAFAFVIARLRRRATAERRIGVAYRPTHHSNSSNSISPG